MYKTGIDLGGTKTEVAVLDAGGDIVYRKRVPTHRGAYAATLDTIRELLEGAERELDFEASSVEIAIPGSVSGVTGRIKNANSTWLNGQNLSRDLSQALQGRPVYLENTPTVLPSPRPLTGQVRDIAWCGGLFSARVRARALSLTVRPRRDGMALAGSGATIPFPGRRRRIRP